MGTSIARKGTMRPPGIGVGMLIQGASLMAQWVICLQSRRHRRHRFDP